MYVTSAANIKYILFANSGILPDSEDRLLNPTWQRRPYSWILPGSEDPTLESYLTADPTPESYLTAKTLPVLLNPTLQQIPYSWILTGSKDPTPESYLAAKTYSWILPGSKDWLLNFTWQQRLTLESYLAAKTYSWILPGSKDLTPASYLAAKTRLLNPTWQQRRIPARLPLVPPDSSFSSPRWTGAWHSGVSRSPTAAL